MNGGAKHGPYYYHFFRDAGRLVKRYVKLGDVDQVRRACDAYRDQRKREREAVRASMAEWRQLLAVLRRMGP